MKNAFLLACQQFRSEFACSGNSNCFVQNEFCTDFTNKYPQCRYNVNRLRSYSKGWVTKYAETKKAEHRLKLEAGRLHPQPGGCAMCGQYWRLNHAS